MKDIWKKLKPRRLRSWRTAGMAALGGIGWVVLTWGAMTLGYLGWLAFSPTGFRLSRSVGDRITVDDGDCGRFHYHGILEGYEYDFRPWTGTPFALMLRLRNVSAHPEKQAVKFRFTGWRIVDVREKTEFRVYPDELKRIRFHDEQTRKRAEMDAFERSEKTASHSER